MKGIPVDPKTGKRNLRARPSISEITRPKSARIRLKSARQQQIMMESVEKIEVASRRPSTTATSAAAVADACCGRADQKWQPAEACSLAIGDAGGCGFAVVGQAIDSSRGNKAGQCQVHCTPRTLPDARLSHHDSFGI